MFHKLFALFFNIYSLFIKPRKNIVALVSMHNENFCDSLGELETELLKENFNIVKISREDIIPKFSNIFKALRFFLVSSARLAKSGYIFLNDNFLPMAFMKLKDEQTVVQLWHAEGAFKRFGFAIPQPENVRALETKSNQKLSYVVCSSEGVRDIYAEAFCVPREHVLPLGTPRTDYFYRKENELLSKQKLYEYAPMLKDKKIILYAPTFRGDEEKDRELLSHIYFDGLKKSLGEDYAIAVRLHPQIHYDTKLPDYVCDLTYYPDVRQLALSCDILITDYSSICMSFAMLEKKTIFYAFDLADYEEERNFYFDYASYVPGDVALNMTDLIQAIKSPFDKQKNDNFVKFNFSHSDGKNTARVINTIIK